MSTPDRPPVQGVHADRTAGRHRHHRHPDRAVAARGAEGPRGGRPVKCTEQPQAARAGPAQLPRHLRNIPTVLHQSRGDPDGGLRHFGAGSEYDRLSTDPALHRPGPPLQPDQLQPVDGQCRLERPGSLDPNERRQRDQPETRGAAPSFRRPERRTVRLHDGEHVHHQPRLSRELRLREPHDGILVEHAFQRHNGDGKSIFGGFNGAARISDVKDGTSNTIAMIETPLKKNSDAYGPFFHAYTHTHVIFDDYGINQRYAKRGGRWVPYAWAAGSLHDGGCHGLMGDGAVKFFSENISLAIFSGAFTMNNGETRRGSESCSDCRDLLTTAGAVRSGGFSALLLRCWLLRCACGHCLPTESSMGQSAFASTRVMCSLFATAAFCGGKASARRAPRLLRSVKFPA